MWRLHPQSGCSHTTIHPHNIGPISISFPSVGTTLFVLFNCEKLAWIGMKSNEWNPLRIDLKDGFSLSLAYCAKQGWKYCILGAHQSTWLWICVWKNPRHSCIKYWVRLQLMFSCLHFLLSCSTAPPVPHFRLQNSISHLFFQKEPFLPSRDWRR